MQQAGSGVKVLLSFPGKNMTSRESGLSSNVIIQNFNVPNVQEPPTSLYISEFRGRFVPLSLSLLYVA